MNKKINFKSLSYVLSALFFFYTSYHITISGYFFSNIILIALLLFFIFLAFILNFRIKIEKKIYFYFLISCMIVFLMLFRNKGVFSMIYMIVGVIYFFVLLFSDKWLKYLIPILKIFAFEHIFFTFFFFIFKDFYKMNILPIFIGSSGYLDLLNQFNHNLVAGFAGNYGSNAIYLSVSFILFCCESINNKKKINYIMSILCFTAILITGKRAALVFSILSFLFIILLKNRKNISKKIIQYSILFTVLILGFVVAAQFIPQLYVTLNRFFNETDISNGRFKLYKLAIELFNNNQIFGIGWGNFKYYSVLQSDYNQLLDVHNNYLQLLCETGIFGFMFFITFVLGTFYKTIKLIIKFQTEKLNNNLVNLLYISFGIQSFILLYAFTGNPLYSVESFYPYMVSCAIPIVIRVYYKEMFKNE